MQISKPYAAFEKNRTVIPTKIPTAYIGTQKSLLAGSPLCDANT